MKHYYIYLLPLITSLLACNPNSGSSPNLGQPSSYSSMGEIQGETFTSDCDNNYRYRLVIGNGVMGKYSDLYETGTNCSGAPIFTGAAVAEIVLGEMSDIVEGAQNLDMTAISMSFIPKNETWLNNLRTQCSNLSWSLNTPTEVSGQVCLMSDPWPSLPAATKYTIFKRTATTVQLGIAAVVCFTGQPCYGGQSPEFRIQEISESRTYYKQ